ncbi:MFS transporter [Sphaerochaeta globosa]|uniref:Major facilitator superfamily MFS_1 n=1 Tax=Sphaerochaeta globosa (strain ATCC BAA-1886 / DSM 22777 / Buddy) TaxID=158189 RepID=F0RTS0_SPHGB|nr:MFS transporter [Sphaerochaeta globosa]ADY13810.1 major facilitator superfamily MFS_1 [Sphaerochaeta globosa str. Buddy]
MGIRILLFAMVMVLAFSGSLFGGLGEEIQRACSISLTQMGLLMSLSQVGSFISFVTLPLLAKRLSAYSLLIWGILASSVTLLGMGLSRNLLFFGTFFLLNALGGYLYGTSNVMVLINVDRAHMKTNIPLMHLTFSIASIFSGYYITYLKLHTWYHGYVQMALAYLVMGLLFIAFKPVGTEQWERRKGQTLSDSFSLLRNRSFVKYLAFLIIANSVEYCNVVYPLLAISQLHQGGAKEVGLAIIMLHAGSTLSRLFAIPLLKKGFAPQRILFVHCLLSMLGLGGFFLAPSLGFAYLSMALMGLGMGGVNPISQVLEISRWPLDLLQLANIRSMGSTLGRIGMPLAVGVVISFSSLSTSFLLLSLSMGIAALFLLASKGESTPC